MVQQALLFSLFEQKWSTRKINKAIGIHHNTISRCKKIWESNQTLNNNCGVESAVPAENKTVNPPHQNLPVDGNNCPAGGVVHFQLPISGTV